MTVTASPSADGKTLTIKINDRFDFKVHGELRQAYQQDDRRYQTYIVDLQETAYMDSSALGMLLQIKDYAGGSKQSVRITHAQPAIRDILAVANFNQLMTID